jgi:cell division protease FtsH
MVNEAAILAARKNKKTISNNDLQEAIERLVLGPERRSRVISETERQITAFHEAGHALVGYLLPNGDPIRKVTIMPRGMTGGSTLFVPEEDINYVSRSRIKDRIVMALAGRAAEEIVFGEITTGASSDLEHVTRNARAMVTRFGMSDKLGPMMFGQKEEMIFLGREISEQRDYSEAVAEEIDQEVRAIIYWAYDEARRLISENRSKLEVIAQRLLEVETIDGDEFLALIGEAPPPRPVPKMMPPAPITGNPVSDSDEGSDRPTLGTAPSPA